MQFDDKILGHSKNEKDLGVRLHFYHLPGNHYSNEKNRINRVLGLFLLETIAQKWSLNCISPHQDYNVQFWRPYYKEDTESLESVQKMMIKKTKELPVQR